MFSLCELFIQCLIPFYNNVGIVYRFEVVDNVLVPSTYLYVTSQAYFNEVSISTTLDVLSIYRLLGVFSNTRPDISMFVTRRYKGSIHICFAIQHYVIKLVSDLQHGVFFLKKYSDSQCC